MFSPAAADCTRSGAREGFHGEMTELSVGQVFSADDHNPSDVLCRVAACSFFFRSESKGCAH